MKALDFTYLHCVWQVKRNGAGAFFVKINGVFPKFCTVCTHICVIYLSSREKNKEEDLTLGSRHNAIYRCIIKLHT